MLAYERNSNSESPALSIHIEERRFRLFRYLRGWLMSLGAPMTRATLHKHLEPVFSNGLMTPGSIAWELFWVYASLCESSRLRRKTRSQKPDRKNKPT